MALFFLLLNRYLTFDIACEIIVEVDFNAKIKNNNQWEWVILNLVR